MVVKKVNLDIVVGVTSALPETAFPEVAFAGKSNVGKSSLINALMNRRSYARTSYSRVRHRLLISIILMMNCILWIFRDTDCQGKSAGKRKMG